MIPNVYIKNAMLAYGEKLIISHLTIDLLAKEWVALLGPSGVGKSSLLRMIAGISMPQEKSHGIIYADNNIPISQQIAYMAQTDLLLPWLTVLDNTTLKLKLRAHTHSEQIDIIDKAISLLNEVGLNEATHLYPQQLSGGMRQRVALVRTLMEDKPIVLMDEPFSALDAITRYKLQELAAILLKGKTVLFITHDPTESLRLANKIYIMQGYPANAKLVAELNSPTPRKLTDDDLVKWQALLFHELTQTTGDV